MKIIKVPEDMDPVRMIKKKCLDRDMACPFCKFSPTEILYDEDYINNQYKRVWDGHKILRPDIIYESVVWNGKQNGKRAFLSRNNRKWMKYIYTCKKCGAKWEGEPFPIDIDKDIGEGTF